MLIANRENFEEVLECLEKHLVISADTETTGLHPFKSSRMFSLAISTAEEDFYFNWNIYKDVPEEYFLGLKHKRMLAKFFENPQKLVFMHNAKFDMHMLANEGIEIAGTVHCTEAIARLVDNSLFSYQLEALSQKYFGEGKDEIKKYIDDHGLYHKEKKGSEEKKIPHYWEVPFDLIGPYAVQDTRLTFKLGMMQREYIAKKTAEMFSSQKMDHVYQNELQLTKTLYHMEKRGILIDAKYTRDSWSSATEKYQKVMSEFKKLTGEDFVDSRKTFKPIFDKLGLSYAKTSKGNASFKDDALEKIDNPVANLIKDYRANYKMSSSYFKNFLDFRDSNDVIHANFRQSGTKTGRMSVTEPALQTLPKGSEEEGLSEAASSVRKCFKPREDYCFFMPDYDQMEYRFFLDLAEEMGVIEEINNGLDVHEATAKVMSVIRKEAKCVSPETWIIVNGKYKRISSLFSNYDKDTFYNLKSNKLVSCPNQTYRRIQQSYCNGIDENILIVARHGILCCSLNHKFLLSDGSMKTAKDLQVGDILAPVERVKVTSKEYVFKDIEIFDKGGKETKGTSFYTKIDENLAYVLGIFLGDGTCSENSISIMSGSVRFGSRFVLNIFEKLEAIKEYKKIFKIPSYIFDSPDSVKYSFLAGLIDTDGTVSKKGEISITSKSWVVAQDIMALSASLGIHTSVEGMYNKKYLRYYFRVRLAKKDSYLFKKFLRLEEKRIRVKEAAFKYKNISFKNVVTRKIKLSQSMLVDIQIDSKDHLYLANGLTTHNTINFLLLYGGGDQKLADALKCRVYDAKQKKQNYFRKLPKVKKLVDKILDVAKTRGYLINWLGRQYKFDDPNFCYRAPNYLVQGGTADAVKVALNRCFELLKGTKSHIVLQVHDEIVFEIHKTELYLCQQIIEIMQNAYPSKHLKLTCSPEHSWNSLGEKVKGYPIYEGA